MLSTLIITIICYFGLQDIGLAHIGNGLSDQSELCQGGLCSLILWNNGLTHEGMGYLSDGLVRISSI